MALEDYMESEVAVAVAATAAMLSPRARHMARRGLVYGVAGVIKAADTVSSAARGVAHEAQSAFAHDGQGAGEQEAAEAEQPPRPRPRGVRSGPAAQT